ncbi:hypothetical protein PTTG_26835 [Puccinia triticina 1-1 BBBD Race 1]|uniref:Uncharacterized protein n=1 Tax=Puccinia triticina (isolate 1-1 / race 1 (BBBD)) TaxID=630390 RepID=A0A180GR36_PUCT1|nr:hypothetical protein PTTG_26835 [Puccinia triticina 1-1 BBBD Race 1]
MWFSTPLKALRQQPAQASTPQTQAQTASGSQPQPSHPEPQPENILLNHHPNINFLSSATPIPSFPKTVSLSSLKQAQRQSEINFLSNFISQTASSPSLKRAHQQPEQQEPELQANNQLAPSTLRLIDQPSADQSSMITLPYPNPDLSSITTHNTLFDSEIQPNPTPARRISALPSRAQTPFKLFKPQPSPLPQSAPQVEHHQFQSPISQHARSPLVNKPTNILITAKDVTSTKAATSTKEPTAPQEATSSQSPHEAALSKAVASPADRKNLAHSEEFISPSRRKIASPPKVNFPTPSAAISDIFKKQDQPIVPSATTIDQVMAELENRTEAGPRITKITFQDQQNSQVTKPTTGRFTDAHGKQFAKYDSITNHYAAKRKNDAPTMNGRSVTNPSKRAKVSDFGYPKRLVSQQETDAEQAEKKKEIVKRQLELARSRRRTGGRTSNIGPKAGNSKPVPSGFSSFGTRLLKSAVKTVAGAFKASQKPPAKVDGVGFGVPAGLGVGPAKVPTAGAPQTKRVIGPPTRMVSKPPLNRLPPAGHHRLLSATSSTSNSQSEAARRRVVSVPTAASSNPPGASKIPPRGATTRAQASAATQPTAFSKSTWQPKTLPKPPGGNLKMMSGPSSRINPPRTRQITQVSSPSKNFNAGSAGPTTTMTTRSRIPKMSTHGHGQTIIRPTVKSGEETSRKAMMTSTSTNASSTRSVVRIGLSAKTVPKKLSQPVQSTKPISTQTRPGAALRRTTTIGSRPPLARKSSSHPSRALPHKDRSNPASDIPKRKILILRKSRRSSLKNVGTKAVSHRVSSS